MFVFSNETAHRMDALHIPDETAFSGIIKKHEATINLLIQELLAIDDDACLDRMVAVHYGYVIAYLAKLEIQRRKSLQ